MTQTEAHLLARAIAQLRQEGDPRAALSTLDQYIRIFPHGVLESESVRARLEALVQVNDLDTALSLLDGKRTFTDPLDVDLLLTRAELRARANRCREAVVDLAQILDIRTERSTERALYDRAVCLGRLGLDDRSRADLITYERQFPRGRFLPEVKRLLLGQQVR
jgi:tetratricopeptide (TPR) repeat protein